MGKAENFVFGVAVGAALGAALAYLFGPAQGTRFDASYRSRLDHALEEGKKAEEARRAELQQQFEQAKRRNTPGQQ